MPDYHVGQHVWVSLYTEEVSEAEILEVDGDCYRVRFVDDDDEMGIFPEEFHSTEEKALDAKVKGLRGQWEDLTWQLACIETSLSRCLQRKQQL